MNQQAQRDINRKLRVPNHAKESGNASKTCRYPRPAGLLFVNEKTIILSWYDLDE